MISEHERIFFASQYNVSIDVINKDYALNLLLFGMSNASNLNHHFIFKGGCCLKKCYFHPYRFSDDVDFTVTDKALMDVDLLTAEFATIATWIYKQTKLEILRESIHFSSYLNLLGEHSITGEILYKINNQKFPSTLKLDLTYPEHLLCQPQIKYMIHPYSDAEYFKQCMLNAYCIEEIFVEKLRALSERINAHDLFDIVSIYCDARWHFNADTIKALLVKKCAFRQVKAPCLSFIKARKHRWKKNWDDSMPLITPSFSHYWREVKAVLCWLDCKPLDN